MMAWERMIQDICFWGIIFLFSGKRCGIVSVFSKHFFFNEQHVVSYNGSMVTTLEVGCWLFCVGGILGQALGGISFVHDQPCWLCTLITPQQHSPLQLKTGSAQNAWLEGSFENWYVHLDISCLRDFLKVWNVRKFEPRPLASTYI